VFSNFFRTLNASSQASFQMYLFSFFSSSVIGLATLENFGMNLQ
jgi:hypothetical protein